MNKPFEEIEVEFGGTKPIQYRNGGLPKLGDLVAKKRPIGYDENKVSLGFQNVYGVVIDTSDDLSLHYKHFPLIQFSETATDPTPILCNPLRLHLISRG